MDLRGRLSAAARSRHRDERGTHDLLGRYRRIFLVAVLAVALVLVPVALLEPGLDPRLRGASLAGLVYLVAWWIQVYRSSRVGLVGGLVEVAAVVAAASGLVATALPLVLVAAGYRCSFGSRGQAAWSILLYSGGLVGLYFLTPGHTGSAEVAQQVVAVGAVGLVAHVLAATLGEHSRTLVRERILSRVGSDLVASRSRQDIYRAVETALSELGAGLTDVRLTLALGTPSRMTVVAAAGSGVDEVRGASMTVPALLGDIQQDHLAAGRGLRVPEQTEGFLPFEPKQGPSLVVPLKTQDELTGLMTLETDTTVPGWVEETLVFLAAQTSLALEGAALTEHFRSLVQNSSDVITVMGADGTIRYQSPALERVFGHRPEDLSGRGLAEMVHPDDAARVGKVLAEAADLPGARRSVEARWRHGDGTWRHAETFVNNLLHDPTVRGIVLNTRDVTERKQLERELAHRALHDPLTDLANRALFREAVEKAMARMARTGHAVAVVFLDVDDFKDVNDSLGHAAGDRLLEAIAQRLSGCVRPYDVAARLGGDEFAVLLEAAGEEVASRVAARIIDAMQAPITIDGLEISTHASLGIAVAKGPSVGVDELLRNADVAMYRAKGRGKGRFEVYDSNIDTSAMQRMELAADLRRALDRGEFELQYQPIVALDGGKVLAMEALLRWQHPERGLLLPIECVPTAEETGLIVRIGRWVVEEACRKLRAWHERHPRHRHLAVAVNVSARQLQDAGFVGDVLEALEAAGADPGSLILEITETVLMRDTEEIRQRLEQLHAAGVRLAIDDFGTGYSSLSYLSRYPVDILKIDRSFIEGVGGPTDLTPVMISIGKTLGLQTVAEGVESSEQLTRLRELGCDAAQGYLFSAPVPPVEVEDILGRGVVASGLHAPTT